MPGRGGAVLSAIAVFAFLAASLSFVPAGLFLRYLSFLPAARPNLAAVCVAVAGAVALEALVRGFLYGAWRGRFPNGAAALLVAALGALVTTTARLLALPQPDVSPVVLVPHALLVEGALSLALTWMALGTGSIAPSSAALSTLWLARLATDPVFRGPAVPALELISAILSAVVVAIVLRRPLAPHREALLGVS